MALVQDESNRLNVRGEEEDADYYTDSDNEADEDYEYEEGSEYEDDDEEGLMDKIFASSTYYYCRRYARMGYQFAGFTSWVLFTSSIVVGFPLLYSVMKVLREQNQGAGGYGPGQGQGQGGNPF